MLKYKAITLETIAEFYNMALREAQHFGIKALNAMIEIGMELPSDPDLWPKGNRRFYKRCRCLADNPQVVERVISISINQGDVPTVRGALNIIRIEERR